MRIYVSGALKGSRDLRTARELYERAAATVAAAGHEPYLPHKNTDPEEAAQLPPERVFDTDLNAIRNSHAVLAFLSEPSLGVGAELAICRREAIPLLGLCEEGVEVSRFAIGCLVAGRGQLVRYGAWTQAQEAILDFLNDLRL